MRRLVCLDGLRGVLAFYVMLSHSLPFVPLPHWIALAVPAWRRGGGRVLHPQRPGDRAVAGELRLPSPAVPDRPRRTDLSGVTWRCSLSPWRCSRWRPRSSTCPGSAPDSPARDTSGPAAGRPTGPSDRHASDDDARPVSRRRAARRLGRLPGRRPGASRPSGSSTCLRCSSAHRLGLVRMAVSVPALAAACARLAGGDAGGMAVQPRLPAEQGTVFRPRRRQRDRGSRPRKGSHASTLSCWPPRSRYAPHEAAWTNCCRRSCGPRALRHRWCRRSPDGRYPAARSSLPRGQPCGRWPRCCNRRRWSGSELSRIASIWCTSPCSGCSA